MLIPPPTSPSWQIHTYRFMGHSPADPEHERGRKVEKRWARAECDPIKIFESTDVASRIDIEGANARVKAEVTPAPSPSTTTTTTTTTCSCASSITIRPPPSPPPPPPPLPPPPPPPHMLRR